jgi:hypothetical protein
MILRTTTSSRRSSALSSSLSSAQPPHRLLALQLALATVILGACGGGGGSAGGAAIDTSGSVVVESVPLQTYITDNLATDYSKVWVSIEKITAVDSSGVEVTLLDATGAPAVVNLSSLASVGHLIAATTVKAGVYTEVRVTLVNSVSLVSLDGLSTITAKLAPTGTDLVVHVRNVGLDTATSGQLVLDFNLAKFSYDAATGLVTPMVEAPKPVDAFGKFVHQQADVNGVVKSVDLAKQTITVDDDRLGKGLVVSLATDAVIVDETSGATVTLAGIAVGAHVEIKGAVTPGATTGDPVTVVASVVHIERTVPPVAVIVVAGGGKVASVSGHLVTVAIDDATFLPGSNSVVVDISSAKFLHGVAADITAGVKVAFHGSLGGSTAAPVVLASDIDVQGAPSAGALAQNPTQKFTAVNGAIATLNGDGTFTVAVTRADGPVVVPGAYTVDASHATYMEGNVSCLAVGQLVQAVGSLVSTTMTAKFMNVKGCTGEKHAEPAPPAPMPPASGAART